MTDLTISRAQALGTLTAFENLEALLQAKGCSATSQLKKICKTIKNDDRLNDLYSNLAGKKKELVTLLPHEASLQRILLHVICQDELRRQDEILMRNQPHELQTTLYCYVSDRQYFLADRLLRELSPSIILQVLSSGDRSGKNAVYRLIEQGCQQLIGVMLHGLNLKDQERLIFAPDNDGRSAATMLVAAHKEATVPTLAQTLGTAPPTKANIGLAAEMLIRCGHLDAVRGWWKESLKDKEGSFDAAFFNALLDLPHLTYFVLKRQHDDLLLLRPSEKKRDAYLEAWRNELRRQQVVITRADRSEIESLYRSYTEGRKETDCINLLAHVFLLQIPQELHGEGKLYRA